MRCEGNIGDVADLKSCYGEEWEEDDYINMDKIFCLFVYLMWGRLLKESDDILKEGFASTQTNYISSMGNHKTRKNSNKLMQQGA